MSSILTRRAVLRAAAIAAAAPAVAPLVMGGESAYATAPGAPGSITYKVDNIVYIANADGSNPRVLTNNIGDDGDWSPDGSRWVYARSGLQSIRSDGTREMVILASLAQNPTYTEDGRYVLFSYSGELQVVGAGGHWPTSVPLLNISDTNYRDRPAVSLDATIIFEQGDAQVYDARTIMRADSDTQLTPLINNAWDADFSPNGAQIVFVRSQQSAQKFQIWIADADGTNQLQLTTEATAGTWNYQPKWSPDGQTILFTNVEDANTSSPKSHVKKINVDTLAITTVVANGSNPTWQPLSRKQVQRVWGQSALDTAIATSRYNFADHGVLEARPQAQAVVLSRNDVYYDALAGSALAVNKQAPLLITTRDALPASIEAEIHRVLGTSGTVYLLGGTSAIPQPIENRLTQLGYTVDRVWGQTLYDTAVAVADRITTTPSTVIVSTALAYYDALAAGAAAGANPGTVIVLTAGDILPAPTAAYLNKLNPDPVNGTAIFTVGGPGERALVGGKLNGQLPNWSSSWQHQPLVGQFAQDTALLVAEWFFDSPQVVGLATLVSWYDALTGGAMIGANGGPLLLTSPSSLDPQVATYLSENSSSLLDAILIGGPNALSPNLQAQLGNAISMPGLWDYSDVTPTSAAAAKSLSASGKVTRAKSGILGKLTSPRHKPVKVSG